MSLFSAIWLPMLFCLPIGHCISENMELIEHGILLIHDGRSLAKLLLSWQLSQLATHDFDSTQKLSLLKTLFICRVVHPSISSKHLPFLGPIDGFN